MDVSPPQSGSKCSSDFSIERILSEDTRPRNVSAEVPNWLCCTRYQPPRIPRSASGGGGGGCRSRRAGRHARVPFSAAQAAALEAAFARAPYLAPPALRALAAALQLRDDRIKIWFQNRRARARREKCTSITPPQAVTLPPTSMTQGTDSSWTSRPPSSIGHRPAIYNQIDSPQDLSTQAYLDWTRSLSDESVEGRPETPLDIETIDEK